MDKYTFTKDIIDNKDTSAEELAEAIEMEIDDLQLETCEEDWDETNPGVPSKPFKITVTVETL